MFVFFFSATQPLDITRYIKLITRDRIKVHAMVLACQSSTRTHLDIILIDFQGPLSIVRHHFKHYLQSSIQNWDIHE